jgi:Protein of unknown function (DUF3631)
VAWEAEEPSQNTALLEDIREAFGHKDEITGEALVSVLVAMHARPWGECNHGRALTQNLLVRKLKPFGIFTKRIGPKRDRARGYDLGSFNDAFSRYTPLTTVHPDTTNEVNDLDENKSVHHDSGGTVADKPNKLILNGVSWLTDENPLNGERDLVREQAGSCA